MYKLRTMHWDAGHSGGRITAGTDLRVFPVGRVLRKTKLDESLQLVNVVRGDMALVGPRPEDPQIVDFYYTPTMMETLEVLPGLTSPGTLHYRLYGEHMVPPGMAAAEQYYVDHLLPRKLALDLAYVRSRSGFADAGVILCTVLAFMGSKRLPGIEETTDAGETSTLEADMRRECPAWRTAS